MVRFINSTSAALAGEAAKHDILDVRDGLDVLCCLGSWIVEITGGVHQGRFRSNAPERVDSISLRASNPFGMASSSAACPTKHPHCSHGDAETTSAIQRPNGDRRDDQDPCSSIQPKGESSTGNGIASSALASFKRPGFAAIDRLLLCSARTSTPTGRALP
jgi:hypothetical protein